MPAKRAHPHERNEKQNSLEDTPKETQNFKFTKAATHTHIHTCSWVLQRNNELKQNYNNSNAKQNKNHKCNEEEKGLNKKKTDSVEHVPD